MRHLTGLALAVALAAAVFFAATWGYVRLLAIPVTNGGGALPGGGGSLLHNASVLESFAALAGPALLAGLCVAVPRISPLAAGLPGLAALAATVIYGFDVDRAVRWIPFKYEAFGEGFEAMLINGLLAVAGLVLIVPLFIPSRWRAAVSAGRPLAPYAPGQAVPYSGGPYSSSPYSGGPYSASPYSGGGYADGRSEESAPAATSAGPESDPTAPYPTEQFPAPPGE